MLLIGLIREGKIPADNRVALIPSQCKWIHKRSNDTRVIVQHSDIRCFTDKEYRMAGVEVQEDLTGCDILLGIKEVPVEMLIPGKTYFIFSHTKKLQPHNRLLLQTIIKKNITLIDYECLEHEDGTRILGFGFFAGVVGAHNGMMAYGERTGTFHLNRVNLQKDFRQLIHTYFGLIIPPIKIVVTGSGRVAHGVLDIMNLMGIYETEPDLFLEKEFAYPVYVHLKGADLYEHKLTAKYNRLHFHSHPEEYRSHFYDYLSTTDILMNGVYWEKNIPRLFEMQDLANKNFRIKTIADISDDHNGSVPCNIGDSTIEDPVYGVDKNTFLVTKPFLENSVDVMAIGNLPNELPRDASRYFGEQLIKYVLGDVYKGGSTILDNATIIKGGILTNPYAHMKEYAGL
jgi:saccharopine dehydrogenase (NAD+, L-lysine forming)